MSAHILRRNFLTAVAGRGQEAEVQQTGTTESTSEPTPIFDPSANVVQQTLANHGWKIGTLVAPKKCDPTTPRADEQFEIGHLNDDGTIGLHRVGVHGVVDKSKVIMTDQVKLQTTYRPIDESARLSRWDALSDPPPAPGLDFWTGVAMHAIVAAGCLHRNCPAGCIYIQKKPSVKVIVSAVPTDNFVFVPCPSVVKKAKDVGHIHLTVGSTPPVVFNVERPDMDAPHVLAFWRMRRVSEKEHANMEISTVEVVCPLPKVDKHTPKSVTVRVPSAVPFKTVARGDELVLHIPARKKAVDKVVKLLPVMSEPLQKKPRVE